MELAPSLLTLIESSEPPKFAPPHTYPYLIVRRLTIKSSPNATAILNTPTKSILLRAVDQCNSLMMFAPADTDGFNLVHTAKQYLELVANPNRVKLEGLLLEWNGGRT